jgi:aspartyl-tRNA(Asn)/glutamyl-tRNA(Gln) amidotransferase subunit A
VRTATETAGEVAAGRLSASEAVDESLHLLERWQPLTNACSAIRPDAAREEARERDRALARGERLGPLHGVPVVVKDLFDVAGWEPTGCCAGYRGRLADRDGEAVRRLREAGAVVVAKANQHELAAGATNLVSACGPTRNPWDPSRITGGSSGGSAVAVAARCVPVALGTDTGGSVRIPASLCGVSGLKPTHGRVSLDGVMPLAPSLDTAGPLATTVEDLAVAFGVMAGTTPGEEWGPVDELTVGLFEGRYVTRVLPEVEEAALAAGRALEDAGATLVRLEGDLRSELDDWYRMAAPEFYEAHGHLLEDEGSVLPPTRWLLERGRDQAPEVREAAARRAAELRARFGVLLEEADLLLAPATPAPATPADQPLFVVGDQEMDVNRGGISLLTRPVNMAGLPALAVPAGFSPEGLPIGIQLIGRPGEEAVLLRAGVAYQAVTDHHLREPSAPGRLPLDQRAIDPNAGGRS